MRATTQLFQVNGLPLLLPDESASGIAGTLKQVLSNSDEILFEKGNAARNFVLDTRNNVVQAAKILEMLK